MKHKTLKTSIVSIFLFFAGIIATHAQEAVVPTGGEATGSGGTVSYTVGQTAYQTSSSTNYTISEGVQQPYEISVVTAIENVADISLKVTAYPNPVVDNLTLSVDKFDISDLSYQLFDLNGKILQKEEIIGNKTKIEMGKYTHGVYFVNVTSENKNIKTFKIIKN